MLFRSIHEVWKAIEFDLGHLDLETPGTTKRNVGVDLLVQPRQEREMKGVSRQGKPQYTTRRWLEITNQGDQDADDFRIEVANLDAGMVLGNSDDGPTTIHRGQMRTVPVIMMMGGEGQPTVRMLWTEDGQEKSKEVHVG